MAVYGAISWAKSCSILTVVEPLGKCDGVDRSFWALVASHRLVASAPCSCPPPLRGLRAGGRPPSKRRARERTSRPSTPPSFGSNPVCSPRRGNDGRSWSSRRTCSGGLPPRSLRDRARAWWRCRGGARWTPRSSGTPWGPWVGEWLTGGIVRLIFMGAALPAGGGPTFWHDRFYRPERRY